MIASRFLFSLTCLSSFPLCFCFFFFNDTATTEIYTLSLHDALPICKPERRSSGCGRSAKFPTTARFRRPPTPSSRSEEHTSELQSQFHLVCRLLLEKKKNKQSQLTTLQNLYTILAQ